VTTQEGVQGDVSPPAWVWGVSAEFLFFVKESIFYG
jgi:hypothetical protein